VPASPARGRAPSSGDGGTPSTPHRRRIFAFSSPAPDAVAGRRLDAPTDAAYSLSPIRPASAAILASPRRDVRGVCKTPYRVLDAPELADDFYLNLVDWAGTNVLGVGLGMSVYLWTAHTAAVSKLCDLSSTADTISAVAWTQRVRALPLHTPWAFAHCHAHRARRSPSAR
jgi:cell division cycle 20-like protein 1 (cofactor of APC complex)